MSIKRTYKICPNCSREISRPNFNRHVEKCNGPKKTKYPWLEWKIGENQYQHPDGYIGNMAQMKLHIYNISEEKKNRSGHNSHHLRLMSGETKPWNYGLTKESHPELSESLSAGGNATGKKIKSGEITPAFLEYTQSEEGRKAKSEWRKQLHIDNPETHPNRRLANNRNKMTYPERIVYDFLTENNITFEHNFPVGGFFPDFLIGKIIIEVDGKYWHDAELDQKRDSILMDLGYEVNRFPVGRNKDLLQRIEQFLIKKNIL